MSAMVITVSQGPTDPNYETTAGGLLAEARTFYRNPENEKAFQEWMKQRKEGKGE